MVGAEEMRMNRRPSASLVYRMSLILFVISMVVACSGAFARSFHTGHFVMSLTDNESRPITVTFPHGMVGI